MYEGVGNTRNKDEKKKKKTAVLKDYSLVEENRKNFFYTEKISVNLTYPE